jgi:hypothetical protein
MREQLAAARRLPFQFGSQGVGVKRGNDKAGLTGKMLGRRFPGLSIGGEVNEAVGEIDRRPLESAAGAGGLPLILRRYFIDKLQIRLSV